MRSSKHYFPRAGRVVRAALAGAAAAALASCELMTGTEGDPDAGVVVQGVVTSGDGGGPVQNATVHVSGFAGSGCTERVAQQRDVKTDAAGHYNARITALKTAFIGCVEVLVDPGAVAERRFGVRFLESQPLDTVRVDVVLP